MNKNTVKQSSGKVPCQIQPLNIVVEINTHLAIRALFNSVTKRYSQCSYRAIHRTRKTVLDRGSMSDRPRYHTHTRWTALLMLVSAAPRRTRRRTSAQLMT